MEEYCKPKSYEIEENNAIMVFTQPDAEWIPERKELCAEMRSKYLLCANKK